MSGPLILIFVVRGRLEYNSLGIERKYDLILYSQANWARGILVLQIHWAMIGVFSWLYKLWLTFLSLNEFCLYFGNAKYIKCFQHEVIHMTLEIKGPCNIREKKEKICRLHLSIFYLLSRKLNPICTNWLYPTCNEQIFKNTEALIGNVVMKSPKAFFSLGLSVSSKNKQKIQWNSHKETMF